MLQEHQLQYQTLCLVGSTNIQSFAPHSGHFSTPRRPKWLFWPQTALLTRGGPFCHFWIGLKPEPKVLPAQNKCKIYKFWVNLACNSGVYQVIQAPEVPSMGNQKQALLLKVHIFRHRKMGFPVPKQKNETTFAPQLSPIMVDFTLVLSICRFWAVFSQFKICKIVLPLARGLIWAKISILAPGRCWNRPSEVQRVKYW